jgi:hypothetical protein
VFEGNTLTFIADLPFGTKPEPAIARRGSWAGVAYLGRIDEVKQILCAAAAGSGLLAGYRSPRRPVESMRATLIRSGYRSELRTHSLRLPPHGNAMMVDMIEGHVKFGGQNNGNRQ